MQSLLYFRCQLRKITTILLLFLSFTAKTQVIFKTIVQKTVVETGESFFVEYILENTGKDDGFTTPVFNGVRLVSGPSVQTGSIKSPDGIKPVKNFIFTLVALKPGPIIIPGATASFNGRLIRSDDVAIEAIEKTEITDNASEYFLQPGEDPYEKIRRNLYLKVMVNKRSCYIGEPVVATFKLYSRLLSKSDIVKNPGFYGFSVQDIVNLDDRISNTETIGGKKFEVHTIRTVQLYPLQAGVFVIDPMEVMNKIEFSKSVVHKKVEQVISEGVPEKREDNDDDNNTVTYESNASTEKISIHVKPYPEKNKPPSFANATGSFAISARLEKNDFARNEQGDLILIVEGKGNFTQLSAPVIQWPTGIEGFDARIRDSLDKAEIPLKGKRTFRFPFVASKAGTYIVPAVSFVYFDTDSNRYKTTSTKAVEIRINDREKQAPSMTGAENNNSTSPVSLWLAGIALALLSVAAIISWRFRKKRKKALLALAMEESKTSLLPVEKALQPAFAAMEKNDSGFYTILQKAIWDYLGTVLNLSGSKMNKQYLQKALQSKTIPGDSSQHILGILQECEAAAFTKAEFIHDKQELLARTREALERIRVDV